MPAVVRPIGGSFLCFCEKLGSLASFLLHARHCVGERSHDFALLAIVPIEAPKLVMALAKATVWSLSDMDRHSSSQPQCTPRPLGGHQVPQNMDPGLPRSKSMERSADKSNFVGAGFWKMSEWCVVDAGQRQSHGGREVFVDGLA